MIGRTNAGSGGGGLGSNDALVRVLAATGATVTIKKGSGSAKNPNFVREYATKPSVSDFYFVVHSSDFGSTSWTITAGTKTANITIQASKLYDVNLSSLVLLNGGVKDSSLGDFKTDNSNLTTFTSAGIELGANEGTGSVFYFSQELNLSSYTNLKVTVGTSNVPIQIGIINKTTNFNYYNVIATASWDGRFLASQTTSNGQAGNTFNIDIANISAGYFAGVTKVNAAGTKTVKISYAELE